MPITNSGTYYKSAFNNDLSREAMLERIQHSVQEQDIQRNWYNYERSRADGINGNNLYDPYGRYSKRRQSK